MNCSEKNCDVKTWGLFALRLAVGLLFVYHGWQKLGNMDQTIGMFVVLNFPLAAFFAYLVAFVEFLGGIAILVGYRIRFASKLLAITMLMALLVVHVKGPFASAELAIALLGSTLALAGVGGGKWQLAQDKECLSFCKLCTKTEESKSCCKQEKECCKKTTKKKKK